MKSTISIIVPSRNRQELLLDLINKFDMNIPDGCEIIIHDNSDEKLTVNIKQKERLFYIYESTQLSVGQNFSSPIDHAKGKYIGFIGDDDLVDFRALSKIIEILEGNDYDSIFSPIYNILFLSGTETKWTGVFNDTTLIAPNVVGRALIKLIDSVSRLTSRFSNFWIFTPDLWVTPKGYFGIFNQEMFSKKNSNFKRPIFLSPDSFMIGRLRESQRVLFFNKQVFVPGTSKTSTSNLSNKKLHIGRISEQKHFDKYDLEVLPIDTPDSFLPEVIWMASYCAGCGQRKIGANRLYLLKDYIWLKYRANIEINVDNYNISFLERTFIKMKAVSIFSLNRFMVTLLISARYLFSRRKYYDAD
ncbi:glycosyltransferase family 2 protein [Dongshaea marina]|uniref:glycosyltransferase family 2 protein n=1 Tax=Dongshaea marina TaxID=2047966 RepID=UPI000D3E83EF|nr:glycosyltransferase [Dongshaea marina]